MMVLGALWHLVGAFAEAGPGSLAVLAAGVLLAVLVSRLRCLRPLDATPAHVGDLARLKAHARPTGLPRSFDPGAAGRSRPRAPGVNPTA
jgi:Family of unknown function (DUF6412)